LSKTGQIWVNPKLVQEVSLRKKSQLCFILSIFSRPILTAVCFGAVRQKPLWRPKRVFNHSRYLPPATILSSTNTRGTALVSCCRMFLYQLVIERQMV
jgi:hypothetical protein